MALVLVLSPILLLVLLLALFIPVFSRLFRTGSAREITAEWLENFAASSYYPMETLLSGEDFRFLSRQPGFDLSLYRKLRRDRLRIFQQYLHRSIRDFNRLHAAVRLMIAHSSQDCSEVASRLIGLRLRFTLAVVEAQCSYWCCLLGFQTLAVRLLIEQLEQMQEQLKLVSAAQTS